MKRTRNIAFGNDDDSEDLDDPSTHDSNPGTSRVEKSMPESMKKLSIKIKKENLKLSCRWTECEFSIERNPSEFIQHVGHHIANLKIVFDDELKSNVYKCSWGNCVEEMRSEIEAKVHLYYHGSLTISIENGAAILSQEGFPQCKRLSSNKDCIPPDLDCSEKLKCLWNKCHEEFLDSYAFYNHVKCHTAGAIKGKKDANPCSWELCKRAFRSRAELDRHMRSHTKEKEILCPTCGTSFTALTALFNHCIRQNEEKPHVCPHCKRGYPSQSLLQKHIFNHMNKYKCPFCEYLSSYPSRIAEHIIFRHLPDRCFKCEFCTFSAKTKASLRRHLDIHFTYAVNHCKIDDCEFSCRSSHAMKTHKAKKHNIGVIIKYGCHICDKKFNRKKTLIKHAESLHELKLADDTKVVMKEDNTYFLDLHKDPPFQCEEESNHSENPLYIAYDQVDEEGNVTSKVLVGAQPMSYMPQVLTLPNEQEGAFKPELATLKAVPITNNYPPMFIFQSSLDALQSNNGSANAFEIITQNPANAE
ncbi:histone H4 transcription factor-like [Neocloeon triangulifer]|uniref:histone H4 transcription factor-like n=1 Tax=Neocloeon triangulifer TaxID=2078957 RepID=UPI00286F3659|nr:histone H4 transcription factor-like [Neocloeon triangulifer]